MMKMKKLELPFRVVKHQWIMKKDKAVHLTVWIYYLGEIVETLHYVNGVKKK